MLLFATTIPPSGVRGLIKNPFDVLKRVFKYDFTSIPLTHRLRAIMRMMVMQLN